MAAAAAAAGGAAPMVADRARARVLPAVDGVAFAPVFDVSLSLVV